MATNKATNKQRREAERRRLQRQLEERRQREQARRRFTLIASIVGTVVVIAAVIVVVVLVVGGGDDTKPAAQASNPPTTATSSAAPVTPVACTGPPSGTTASFKGVTVGAAKDLKHEPKVRSTSASAAPGLSCEDLVVGTGKAANPKSSVKVQYTGVLYSNGKEFDSSWAKGGKPVQFSLTGVVPGFTQGIGGTGKVAPMKVGGRRIIIMPASLAYGSTGNSGVPANASLVFVVDLTSVS